MESSFQASNFPIGVAHLQKLQQSSARVSRPAQWRLFTGALVVNDIFLTGMAFLLAGWIRFNLALPVFNLEAKPLIPAWTTIVFGLIPLWIVIYAAQGLYMKRNLLGGLQEYSGVFRATSIAMLLIVIAGFLRPLMTPARGWVLVAWILAVVFVIGGRFILRRAVYALRLHGYFLSPALIVGANSEARSLAEQLILWRTSGLLVLGFVSDRVAPGTSILEDLPVVGTMEDLEGLVATQGIEELILSTSALTQEQILDVFKTFGVRTGVNLRLSTGLFEVITTGLEVKEIASVPLVQVNQARLTGLDWLLKSGMDVALGVIGLALSLPLMLIIAIAIRLESRGPIFYRRRVVGFRGKPFDAFKFRTMMEDGDDILRQHPELMTELASTQKLKDDPRITRVGKVLRKYSLDELPQFVNVLRREMSVVGPRMISPDELALYDKWDMNLLTVLPGITGLWQVSGRSDVAYDERVQLDMRYIRNWSIWLDMQILMRTVGTVLRGQGAY